MTLMPEERAAITQRLLVLSAQLKEFDERFHLPISEWAALCQEKLSLEQKLAGQD